MDWHLDDGDVRIALGDARDRLPELADNSVQCLVTSPPFWNLRDYGEEEQIGLEETPEEWCAAVVEVMRECRRVLRKDGVAWIEVGDTYNAFNANRGASSSLSRKSDPGRNEASPGLMAPGLKNKDLVGAPWMLAFALRDDGWYLRAENIWWKQNGMPESCTDRPTRMHTQVFLLSKSDRYFYDRYAVLEPHQPDGRKQTKVASNGAGVTTHSNYANRQGSERWPGAGRNLRSVWSLPTEATHHGHYAAFPVHLAKRCILPGTSEHGCCAECGAPYERIADATFVPQEDVSAERAVREYAGAGGSAREGWAGVPRGSNEVRTVGWEPSCGHADAGVVPCVVLDPFLGSGTTAVAARALGRHAVGIELSREYLAIADDRLRQQSLLT